jgi:hypothetical protein
MIVEETIENGIIVRKTIYEPSDMATQEQKDAWLEVCNTCEYKQEDRCNYCDCWFNNIMSFKTATCPLNKW